MERAVRLELPRKRGPRPRTILGELRTLASLEVHRLTSRAWPLVKYQRDPAGFCREILGVEPTPDQVRILEAIRDGTRVAVRSGQKCGKSKIVVCAALWLFSCFPYQRVFMTAVTREQVERVLWKELRWTLARAKIQIPGTMNANPADGFQAADGREILAFTVRALEAMSGLSGRICFIVDEASALEQPKFEAIEGNTIGGGKIVLISNPTRTAGPFFDAFYAHKKYWILFHLSSERIAQWQETRGARIEGLADMAAIRLWEVQYGKESPFFKIRVLGEFVTHEEGKICTLFDIDSAQRRWADTVDDGDLAIGIDWAGPGEGGDEWAFAVVRGSKCLAIVTRRGLTVEQGIGDALALLRVHRRGDEVPRLMVDIEGPTGGELWGRLKALSETSIGFESFTVHGVKASSWARRSPQLYERVRDELWANIADWLRRGGAIPPDDHKLAEELRWPSWESILSRGQQRLKATAKDRLRSPEMLGRSPDRADALGLALWVPHQFLDAAQGEPGDVEREPDGLQAPGRMALRDMATLAYGNPYELLEQSMGGGRRG